MSVIYFCRDEIIAALGAAWYHGSIGSLDGLRKLAQYAEIGNLIMAANAAAYSATYDEVVDAPQPITGVEVKRYLIGETIDKRLRGMRVLRSIRYNLVANNGQDFATIDILDGLLWFIGCVMDRATTRVA